MILLMTLRSFCSVLRLPLTFSKLVSSQIRLSISRLSSIICESSSCRVAVAMLATVVIYFYWALRNLYSFLDERITNMIHFKMLSERLDRTISYIYSTVVVKSTLDHDVVRTQYSTYRAFHYILGWRHRISLSFLEHDDETLSFLCRKNYLWLHYCPSFKVMKKNKESSERCSRHQHFSYSFFSLLVWNVSK